MGQVRKVGNVLRIKTSFPTIDGAPSDDESGTTVNVGTLDTHVEWPNNWSKLTPKWRAQLLARLVKKVVDNMLLAGPRTDAAETFKAFEKLTGWKF